MMKMECFNDTFNLPEYVSYPFPNGGVDCVSPESLA